MAIVHWGNEDLWVVDGSGFYQAYVAIAIELVPELDQKPVWIGPMWRASGRSRRSIPVVGDRIVNPGFIDQRAPDP